VFPAEIAATLSDQSGVISRRQLSAAGARGHDIQGWRRRKDLVIVHPGVYLDHTGPLTWLQRAWAAVLWAAPAALWGESALRAHEGPGRPGSEDGPIHVAIAPWRRVVEPADVRVHRRVRFDDWVLSGLRPPRQRFEDAVLEVALGITDRVAALEVLARAVQQRHTTAARLRDSLDTRPRAPDRLWLSGVLHDLATGACSVLEHGYLTDVERAHGLPTGRRQVAATASVGLVYRDNEYEAGLLVELDGRLFHDSARQRDLDFERDLDAAVDGKTTRRLGYGQVFGRPCSTAGKTARLLSRAGWEGRSLPCGAHWVAPAVFDGGLAA
jgi:hypothetical protein